MEYWIMNTDHNLWKIIQNGNNKKRLGRNSKGGIIILPLVSFEEHVAVQRETKERTLLLQSLPEDHMADFHHLDDNREIWLAVKARFGGNEESKKMRKTMSKQAFSEFSHYGRCSSSFVTKNEPTQQLAYEDFEQVDQLEMEELDIKWQMAMLSLRINKFQKKAENKTEEAKQVYGLMAGFESDFVVHAGNAAGGVNSVAVKFAMMGISPKVQTCPFECDSKLSDLKKNYEPLEKLYNDYFIQVQAYKNIVKTLEHQKDWYHTTQLALEEKIRIFSANLENTTNTLKYSKTLYDQAKLEKKEWEVKFVESLARFDKWKESSKNLAKLLYSSMSTRTKLGLGFKDYIRSDEVYDLSTPSIFDPEPDNREFKSLYERFVKAGNMHEVPPPFTGTFMPTSYQYDLAETQATFGLKSTTSSFTTSDSNDFVSCDNSDKSLASETFDFASCVLSPKTHDSFSTVDVKFLPKSDVKNTSLTNGLPICSFKENVKPPMNLCNKSGAAKRIPYKNNFARIKKCFVYGSKSHLIKDCNVYDIVDNFLSVVSKAASVPAGSRNSSASTSAGQSIPAASRNRSASIHAGRSIPAASRNRSASIHAGRSIPAASRNRPASIHAVNHIHAGRINKPAPIPAGSSVPTGWTNPTTRSFFRPINLYFDNVYWLGIYDHMYMNKGRWGSAVKTSVHPHVNKDIGIVDSGCSKSMTGNKDKLDDFVVSITNPHNKTPYEFLSGKVPNIRHLKPFGCQVTILNTSDHLGKFEGKANDGFLVGMLLIGLGQELYFDLDYLTDSLGYTHFKTNPPAGTYDTNILAGTQADDSESKCDEHVILVPSFPSNSFLGPTVHDVSAPMENNLDYAEELARLQRQEYEAHSAAAKQGFKFFDDTAALFHPAAIETRRNLVLATGAPAPSIVSTGGVPAGSVPASDVPAASLPASGVLAGSVPASGVPAGSLPASSVPAGEVLAGSIISVEFGDPAASAYVPAVFSTDTAATSPLYPAGIFSSSSYDDDFCADVTNLASNVVVDLVATMRVNTIHPESQIIRALQSPVQTRSTVQKSKFSKSAFLSYVHNQNRTNHADHLHCLFACFLSQLEASSVAKALEDPDWVAAMQEEMQQFYNQQV
nr:ribonuclease H-like domain-containing protein [Tanacetum cinerariifolium]